MRTPVVALRLPMIDCFRHHGRKSEVTVTPQTQSHNVTIDAASLVPHLQPDRSLSTSTKQTPAVAWRVCVETIEAGAKMQTASIPPQDTGSERAELQFPG